MNKIKRSSELLWLFGIIFVALGVAICSKANLGVSMIAAPAFVVSDALAPLWSGFSVGVVEYGLQGILLIVMCFVVGKFNWRYLLAFAVAVIYGYTLDLFLWLLGGLTFDTVAMRWVMLIVGDIITAFGVACFFKTYMPLQVYELFVAEVASRFGFKLTATKCGFDMSLLSISLILVVVLFGGKGGFDFSTIGYASFHSIGLGTLVTTAINSPIIGFMSKMIDKIFDPTPMFPKVETALKRN